MPDTIMLPVATAADDPMLKLLDEYQRKLRALERSTPENDAELEEEWDTAQARLCCEPTTSLLGILLKLEVISETDDYEGHLQDNPQLLAARTILGIIDDIRRSLGMPARDRRLPRRLSYAENQRRLYGDSSARHS